MLGRRDFLALAAGTSVLAAPRSVADGHTALLPVPYYSERSDLDSLVACARMTLGFFEPDKHFPYADVAEMVYHREGFWTFEAQLLPIMAEKGHRAVLTAKTPYAALAAGKVPDRYGKEANERIDRTALKWALPYLNEKYFHARPAAFDESLAWLAAGDVVILSVSRAALRADPSLAFCPYAVVLTGRDGDTVRFHDPAAGPHRAAKAAALQVAFEADADRAALRISRVEKSSVGREAPD